MRIMIDSMIYDLIVADSAVQADIEAAMARGSLTLVSTHIQRDQLSHIPDEIKRLAVLGIPVEQVPTSGAIWGISKWGEATWGNSRSDTMIAHVVNGGSNHHEDALIAATAEQTVDLLVTEDGRIPKRVRASGSPLATCSFAEFKQLLGSLACATGEIAEVGSDGENGRKD